MPRLKIHPLFIVLAGVMCLTGKALAFFSVLLSALLHELAHALAAKNQGYICPTVTLMPYGAVLSSESKLSPSAEVIIAAAGPIFSLLLSLLTVAFWWILPESLSYTKNFYIASLTVGVFNLMPVYPLDGARIALGLSKNRPKTLKLLKRLGIAFSFLLFAGFIATAFFQLNLSLGILAVFLFVGATSGANGQMYEYILNNSPFSKSYEFGVREETVYISASLNVRRAMKMVNGKSIKTFKIVNDEGKIAAVISEAQLLDLVAEAKGEQSVGEILWK